MPGDVAAWLVVGCPCGAVGEAGDLEFRQLAAAGEPLESLSAAVPGLEVLPRVDAARVVAQLFFDHADRFEEIGPVEHIEQAKTGDAVADGDLVGGLLMVLALADSVGVAQVPAHPGDEFVASHARWRTMVAEPIAHGE